MAFGNLNPTRAARLDKRAAQSQRFNNIQNTRQRNGATEDSIKETARQRGVSDQGSFKDVAKAVRKDIRQKTNQEIDDINTQRDIDKDFFTDTQNEAIAHMIQDENSQFYQGDKHGNNVGDFAWRFENYLEDPESWRTGMSEEEWRAFVSDPWMRPYYENAYYGDTDQEIRDIDIADNDEDFQNWYNYYMGLPTLAENMQSGNWENARRQVGDDSMLQEIYARNMGSYAQKNNGKIKQTRDSQNDQRPYIFEESVDDNDATRMLAYLRSQGINGNSSPDDDLGTQYNNSPTNYLIPLAYLRGMNPGEITDEWLQTQRYR